MVKAMIKVMFVCHGNIYRLPMAEFICKDLVQKQGLRMNLLLFRPLQVLRKYLMVQVITYTLQQRQSLQSMAYSALVKGPFSFGK